MKHDTFHTESTHAESTVEANYVVASASLPAIEVAGVCASFSERIRLLIKRVGSATEIARMCGFSEGVVRSWRDGNSDPSRARCVTLARTLGVSLVWLVAGEGAMYPEPSTASSERRTADVRPVQGTTPAIASFPAVVDSARLDMAKRLLQSGLALSGISLSRSDHADMLVSLYEIVGAKGGQLDTQALLAFNQRLAAYSSSESQRSI